MPINNITQTISTIPKAGRRGVDVQTVFVNKQEDFQDHLADITIDELNTLKDQLNIRIGEINSTTTTMNGYADTASAGASTATTKAGEAATSATAALTSKNQASTFATNSSNSATKSSQWADNNYNVAVEAGKYSAKHWATEAQNVVLNKVNKVTSTDNAIVRFDGTTGDVQNSGVIIADNGNLLLNSGTGGLGYGTGAGGTVTQLASKSTAVTLNKPSGRIIMHNAALAAGATANFALSNSLIASTDLVYCHALTSNSIYRVEVYSVDIGQCSISVKNEAGISLSDSLGLAFCIIKGATA